MSPTENPSFFGVTILAAPAFEVMMITVFLKSIFLPWESVPGTSVFDFEETDVRTEFEVEGFEDTQITLELEAEQEYEVFVDDVNIGRMTTNLGGKLVLSVELGSAQKHVKVVRV